MRLALGLAAILAATLGFGEIADARDKGKALKLPSEVDFVEGASNPAFADEGAPMRPRPRIQTGPSDDGPDRIALAADQIDYRLRRIGVRDGSEFRDRSRLYLFAADGERAVGYNLTRGQDGGWERQGLSLDDGAFLGEAQAGVAWRKGDVQTSFGYTHREVKRLGRVGYDRDEGVVGLQFSFRPSR